MVTSGFGYGWIDGGLPILGLLLAAEAAAARERPCSPLGGRGEEDERPGVESREAAEEQLLPFNEGPERLRCAAVGKLNFLLIFLICERFGPCGKSTDVSLPEIENMFTASRGYLREAIGQKV